MGDPYINVISRAFSCSVYFLVNDFEVGCDVVFVPRIRQGRCKLLAKWAVIFHGNGCYVMSRFFVTSVTFNDFVIVTLLTLLKVAIVALRDVCCKSRNSGINLLIDRIPWICDQDFEFFQL